MSAPVVVNSAVEKALAEFKAIKTRRAPNEKIWDLIAQYVLTRKRGFSSATNDGAFYLYGDVYDNTAAKATAIAASAYVGALWKNGARTFRISPPKSIKNLSTKVKEYYTEVNRRVTKHMEHRDAGFTTAFFEYMLEEVAFGTSAIGVFRAKEGSKHKLEFRAMELKSLYVVEDAMGRVAKVFYEVELDASQLVDEYGSAALTDKVKAAYESNDFTTKFKVLWIIRPRKRYNPKIKNNQNMPWESIHILEEDKIELRNSGFWDNQIKVVRFYKNQGEEYGRSAGMDALPSIIEVNGAKEIIHKTGEKELMPPLYVLDDGSFGGGFIDQSPNALNVLDISSRISNTAPIGVVGTTGDAQLMLKLVEMLRDEILSHFSVDRLLDLNNQTRMTLGEAQIRNEMRSDSNGGTYSRQMDEGLTPLIQTAIGMLAEDGELGVIKGSPQEKALLTQGIEPLYIPDEVIKARTQGEDIFDIEYISPAARILRSEELRGVMNYLQFAGQFYPVAPEYMLRVNKKVSGELVRDLGGAPPELFNSDEEYADELKKFEESQQLRMQMEMAKTQADVAAKQGSAAQQTAQAEATRSGMGGGGAPGGTGISMI